MRFSALICARRIGKPQPVLEMASFCASALSRTVQDLNSEIPPLASRRPTSQQAAVCSCAFSPDVTAFACASLHRSVSASSGIAASP